MAAILLYKVQLIYSTVNSYVFNILKKVQLHNYVSINLAAFVNIDAEKPAILII